MVSLQSWVSSCISVLHSDKVRLRLVFWLDGILLSVVMVVVVVDGVQDGGMGAFMGMGEGDWSVFRLKSSWIG